MDFTEGMIEGVKFKFIKKVIDPKGWIAEAFRQDELERHFWPQMGFVIQTNPGASRGPYEHREQNTTLVFLGPSNFQIYLWDNRPNSPTYKKKMVLFLGRDFSGAISVPAGVVYGFKNVGAAPGLVMILPSRLFKGPGKTQKADLINYERRKDSPFRIT